MKLLLLQISDIHAREHSPALIQRFGHVARALKHHSPDVQALVLVLSGDIAYSGKKSEYDLAGVAIKPMLAELADVFKGAQVHVVGVPGNHDCDFSHPMAEARRLILEGIARSSSGKPDENTLNICSQIQEEFFKFLDLLGAIKPTFSIGHTYYEHLLSIDNQNVSLRCFNTAFSSALKETAGSLVYPTALLQERAITPPPVYTVAVLHHPYNWFAPNIKRAVSNHAETTCDLIFTGHEHTTAYYKKESFSGLVTNYVEGAVFQEHGDDTCGFNVALIDLTSNQERLFAFSWNADHYAETEITDGWRAFRRSKSKREFELTDAVCDYVQDPGATFTHPAKGQLLLEDIYVPPNAQELTFKDGKDLVRKGLISSKDLLSFIANKQRVLIIGKERSGKSTLSKVLFRQFYGKNMLPILIKGEEIKGTDADKFEALVESRLKQDYKNPLLDKFRQLTNGDTVVIIDDFDHAKLNARGRLKLLDAIHKRYARLVILGDDLLRFEEMACGELGSKVLFEYTQIELMEYGHVLRSAIVDKWYDVNREYVTNPDELSKKVTHAERLIDEILGRSYLPSYPIFILTLLQGFDTSEPIGNSAGSYGYLYSVLITKRLAEGDKQLSLDKKLAYLVELAFHMFKTGRRDVSVPEFEVFHTRHCKQYVPIDLKLIVRELELAGVVDLFHDHYRFKYDYFYYYFVAQYFARHIEEEDARKHVAALCEQLQKEDNANIWLFLTHQSRSGFVLDTILKHATHFFASIAPPNFEADVQFLTRLYEKVPQLVYVNKSPEELRVERRKLLDEAAAEFPDATEESEETDEALQTIAKLKAALRTLEVMGQIVKNYAGSMTTDPKYELVKECYKLGLRVVGVIFEQWQKSGDQFVQEVLDVVLQKEENIQTKKELEEHMKQFIFYFCEATAFNIVKRISQAVGTKDLNDIYSKVLSENSTNAFHLVDLSVKLDSVGFPTGDIYDLHEKFKDNIFCTRVLSQLVINHFYLFNTSEQTKQKVCEKLGIKMQLLRGVDARTADQKRVSDKPSNQE